MLQRALLLLSFFAIITGFWPMIFVAVSLMVWAIVSRVMIETSELNKFSARMDRIVETHSSVESRYHDRLKALEDEQAKYRTKAFYQKGT